MTSSVQEKFDKAAKYIRSLSPRKLSRDTQLKYYAFYKQGTAGDVNIARPDPQDPVGMARWNAWDCVKGTSKQDAQKLYVKFAFEDLRNLGATKKAHL